MEKAKEKIWWRNDHPPSVKVDHFGYNVKTKEDDKAK
jgi:hypothetical protein